MRTNGNNTLKVGMKVIYRGAWGTAAPKEVTVEFIELCENEHEKYGIPVDEVPVKDIEKCCLSLSDEHWAYGYQVTEIIG